jgi:DnaK suppressor protein
MPTLTDRTAALRELLLDQRRELGREVTRRVRTTRAPQDRDVGDMLDTSDADTQVGLDMTLLQMKTATLNGIASALRRLEAGTYGNCRECGREIAERRLRAIPFAARCQACEGQAEHLPNRETLRPARPYEDAVPDAPWR